VLFFGITENGFIQTASRNADAGLTVPTIIKIPCPPIQPEIENLDIRRDLDGPVLTLLGDQGPAPDFTIP